MCQGKASSQEAGRVRNDREVGADGAPVFFPRLELLVDARRLLSQRRAVDDKLLLGVEAKIGVELVVEERVDGADAAIDGLRGQVQVLADMACVEEQAAIRALVIAPDHAVGHGCPDKRHRAQLDHLLFTAQIRDVLQGLRPGLDELQLVLDCKESVDAGLQASDRPDHEIGLKGMAGAPRRYGAQSTRTLCNSLDALRAPQEEGELFQRQCFVAVQADAVTPIDYGPKVNRRDDQRCWVREVDDGHAVVEWQLQGRLRQTLFLIRQLRQVVAYVTRVVQKLLSRIHRSPQHCGMLSV